MPDGRGQFTMYPYERVKSLVKAKTKLGDLARKFGQYISQAAKFDFILTSRSGALLLYARPRLPDRLLDDDPLPDASGAGVERRYLTLIESQLANSGALDFESLEEMLRGKISPREQSEFPSNLRAALVLGVREKRITEYDKKYSLSEVMPESVAAARAKMLLFPAGRAPVEEKREIPVFRPSERNWFMVSTDPENPTFCDWFLMESLCLKEVVPDGRGDLESKASSTRLFRSVPYETVDVLFALAQLPVVSTLPKFLDGLEDLFHKPSFYSVPYSILRYLDMSELFCSMPRARRGAFKPDAPFADLNVKNSCDSIPYIVVHHPRPMYRDTRALLVAAGLKAVMKPGRYADRVRVSCTNMVYKSVEDGTTLIPQMRMVDDADAWDVFVFHLSDATAAKLYQMSKQDDPEEQARLFIRGARAKTTKASVNVRPFDHKEAFNITECMRDLHDEFVNQVDHHSELFPGGSKPGTPPLWLSSTDRTMIIDRRLMWEVFCSLNTDSRETIPVTVRRAVHAMALTVSLDAEPVITRSRVSREADDVFHIKCSYLDPLYSSLQRIELRITENVQDVYGASITDVRFAMLGEIPLKDWNSEAIEEWARKNPGGLNLNAELLMEAKVDGNRLVRMSAEELDEFLTKSAKRSRLEGLSEGAKRPAGSSEGANKLKELIREMSERSVENSLIPKYKRLLGTYRKLLRRFLRNHLGKASAKRDSEHYDIFNTAGVLTMAGLTPEKEFERIKLGLGFRGLDDTSIEYFVLHVCADYERRILAHMTTDGRSAVDFVLPHETGEGTIMLAKYGHMTNSAYGNPGGWCDVINAFEVECKLNGSDAHDELMRVVKSTRKMEVDDGVFMYATADPLGKEIARRFASLNETLHYVADKTGRVFCTWGCSLDNLIRCLAMRASLLYQWAPQPDNMDWLVPKLGVGAARPKSPRGATPFKVLPSPFKRLPYSPLRHRTSGLSRFEEGQLVCLNDQAALRNRGMRGHIVDRVSGGSYGSYEGVVWHVRLLKSDCMQRVPPRTDVNMLCASIHLKRLDTDLETLAMKGIILRASKGERNDARVDYYVDVCKDMFGSVNAIRKKASEERASLNNRKAFLNALTGTGMEPEAAEMVFRYLTSAGQSLTEISTTLQREITDFLGFAVPDRDNLQPFVVKIAGSGMGFHDLRAVALDVGAEPLATAIMDGDESEARTIAKAIVKFAETMPDAPPPRPAPEGGAAARSSSRKLEFSNAAAFYDMC